MNEQEIKDRNIPSETKDEPLTFLISASLSRPVTSMIYPDGTTEDLNISGVSI